MSPVRGILRHTSQIQIMKNAPHRYDGDLVCRQVGGQCPKEDGQHEEYRPDEDGDHTVVKYSSKGEQMRISNTISYHSSDLAAEGKAFHSLNAFSDPSQRWAWELVEASKS